MKKIQLKTGTLIVPDDYKIIESTRTEDSDYAGVIEVTNSNFPHLVVLSEKPIRELMEDEADELIDCCFDDYPELMVINEQSVRPEYDEMGNIINVIDCLNSSYIGLFAIQDVTSEKELKLETGIIRRK